MRTCHPIRTNAVIDAQFVEDLEAVEPVSLVDMKNYLKVDYTTDDALIESMIKDGRMWIEKRCGISFIQKTVMALVEVMNEQELPYGPMAKLGILVEDEEGNTVTSPSLIGLDFGFISLQGYGRFTVTYQAGFDGWPQSLQEALKAYVAYSYENRGDELRSGNIDNSENAFARIARKKSNPYRRTVGF